MPTHPDGQHGKNSQIQAKGIGKNSKRHDLDGTPGLSKGSSLISGQTKEFERGQKVVADTQQAQGAPPQQAPQVNAPVAPPSNAEGQFAAPDPVSMAIGKIGGNLTGAGQEQLPDKIDFSNWLPLLRRLATGPTASGILQRAFVKRMTAEMNKQTGGSAALIRQRDFDKRLEQLNGS